MARRKYTKEEVKQIRKERKIKAALRSYRCRGLKNFLFWLTGLISAFVLLISAIFVGIKFVPISTYVGDTGEVVSKEISSKSILDAIMDAQTYDMTDFPFIADALDDFVKGADLDKYVEIDVDKMKTLKFDNNFTTEIQSCIKVVATLDSVGGTEMLGDFAKLDIFSEWKEVESEDLPATTGGVINKNDKGEFAYNPKLYYYKAGVGSGNVLMSAGGGEFVRVFDDNGHVVDGYNGETIYFANLARVPILDVVDLLDESIGRLELTNIIGSFGGGAGFEDSFLGGILDGKNISDLENFSGEDILLSSILGEYNDDTKLMYDILCSIVIADEKPTYDTLSLAHLQGGIAFEGLLISSFIQGEMLDLFSSIIVDKDGNSIPSSELSIGHLTNGEFKLESLKLSGLLDEDTLDLICSILVDENGNSINASDLTVGHLTNGDFKMESLKLAEFLDKETIDLICSILVDENGNSINASDLTVGHLTNGEFKMESLKLADFLDKETIDLICSILVDENGNSINASDLTVGHLTTGEFKIESLKLADFLDKETLDLICSILVDENGNSINASDLTVGHLTTGEFKIESLKLADFLDKEMVDLLCSIIVDENGNSISASDLTVGHLNGGVKIENLKLSEVLDEEIIDLLCSIIVDENGDPIAKEDLTVAHLSGEWNISDFAKDLSLEEFLGSYSENKEMYDLLHSIIVWEEGETKPTADKLTVGDLSRGIDIDELSLSQFLGDYNENKEMYDLLHSIIIWEAGQTKPTADKLTVGHLANGINFDNLSLSSFLGDYSENKEMYDLLHSIIIWEAGETKPTADKLTVGHLANGINFDNLSLSSFLGDYSENKEMYDMLHSIINWKTGEVKPTADKLTVGHLANGINFDNLSLSSFLGDYSENKEMYDMLHSIINWKTGEVKPTADKLTVGHLANGINFDNLSLQNFLGDYDANKDMYEMLHSIINWKEGVTPPTADKLTVGDLSNGIDFDKMNYDDLSLSKFLGSYEEHQDMYDLLHAIIDWQEGDKIPAKDKLTVGDLSKGIEFDKLSLDHFLGGYVDNKLTYDVLCSAVGLGNGADNYSKLTIAHLKGDLDFTIVPLEVLGFDGATLNMLLNAVNASLVATGKSPIEKGDLTINHIKSGVFSYIALTDVMPFDGGENGNAQLYSILLQASGVSITNPADKNELSTKAQGITINSLSNFKIDLVNLSTILPVSENTGLYNILVDVTGKDAGVIKISDFANFDASKIHLSTVMQDNNNVILKKLIESGATIGGLGSAIDGLSLYDIYGQNCFVERKPGSTAPAYRYDEQEKAYILDEAGTYEISKNSGIWLLICFDSEGIEQTNSKAIGCAQKYTISSATLSTLTNGAGITEKITNATIRQLVDAGILSSAITSVYTKTLQQVANGQIF